MDINKSTRIALAKKGWSKKRLSEELGVSAAAVSGYFRNGNLRTTTIQKLADMFEMKVSEFIALGED